MYQKIYLVGIVASGKTTLSKELSKMLCVPAYELDSIVHHETETERYKRNDHEQMVEIKRIDKEGGWIFEGVHRSSYASLYEMSDIILFLDPPLYIRYIRIFTRWLKQNIGLESCNYKPGFKMLKMMYKWTNDFEKGRNDFEVMLGGFEDKVIRLNDKRDIKALFAELERGVYEEAN